MKQAFAVAPGAIWAAIILGLTGGATLLADYFGATVPAWVPALILTVLIPVLKVLATNESPAALRDVAAPAPVRSKFNRWLW